ncbi:MAG: radical SAM family heme chaperone HemW [Pirellulales bacterium]|jgi:oxygen-independent coproporphyrinogen-3 oxidase
MTPTPRSLYIHIPFCRHRCGYCNFTLVAGKDDLIDAYLDALEIEIGQRESPVELDTLFFGGGTPSHLNLRQLERLFSMIRQSFHWNSTAEISLEANPIDITADKVALLSSVGVNRVSLGVQSFNNQKLKTLERDHDQTVAITAVNLLRPALQSLAVDLIFATPSESLKTWNNDLETATSLDVNHVSTYGLTFEKGTAFWSRLLRSELNEAEEELQRDMYLSGIDHLTAHSLQHYEVSNFAKPGHSCRHNEAYWLGHSYFAFGAGAARYVDGKRETNHRSTTTYIKKVRAGESPTAESEMLDPESLARERLVFGLRRMQGIELTDFQQQTGYQVQQLIQRKLEQYLEANLLEIQQNHLRLTRAGLLVSDSIWPDFL